MRIYSTEGGALQNWYAGVFCGVMSGKVVELQKWNFRS
jgi:hypothetical protein